MIEEAGKVVAIEDKYVWVETVRESACTSCTSKAACGQRLLEMSSSGKSHVIRVLSNQKVDVGDEVVLGIEESVMFKSAVLAYLFPLLSLFLGAYVFSFFWGIDDLSVGSGALAGLLTGLWFVRYYSKNSSFNKRCQPVILQGPDRPVVF